MEKKPALNIVYFQPPGMNKKYVEAGIILESDKDYIHYLDEPCKILISEVKLIDKKDVILLKNGEIICTV